MKKLFVAFCCFVLLITGVAAAALYWLVAVNPGELLSASYLEKVLAVESPVYYRDGRNKMGVFFEKAHRQYLQYPQVPSNFVNSIVAAEDHQFFEHFGIDVLGICRAMYSNIKAGRIVQGGSTITQQTAKNLYKRKDRSLQEKLKELLYALRLEYHYSKEKILEFYVNQFYVSGNGHGLGVAARYYFDKSASQLTLLECAFIAGSVKRPNYYNPFVKRDDQARRKARQRAKERTRYVLDSMFKLGMISSDQYQENIRMEIPFHQGQMSYALNTIMDLVKEALAEQEVEAALVKSGVDNIATSGIKIITTIDKEIQEQSLYALRKELSRLTIRLEGYQSLKLQAAYSKLFGKQKVIGPQKFLFGEIGSVSLTDDFSVKVLFAEKNNNGKAKAVHGIINRDSVRRVVSALVKYDKHKWAEFEEKDVDSFLETLSVGHLVYVSVREYDAIADRYILDLERYPDIQGGVVALKDGVVRAMVGGNENRFFNRARARRLMGSVAKPLLYTAAIQLGWNAIDLINNSRDAFVFHDKAYFPRPDHNSPFAGVSLNWAGVKSENVASVWLLYHLCDQLDPIQFKELVRRVGLARLDKESYNRYRTRIRDEHGILINNEKLLRLSFERAREEIEPDLLFDGKITESELLHRFHYSLVDTEIKDNIAAKEAKTRREILRMSFVGIATQADELIELRQKVGSFLYAVSSDWEKLPLQSSVDNQFYFDSETERYAYASEPPSEAWEAVALSSLPLGGSNGRYAAEQFDWDAVLLEGMISLETFNLLRETQLKEYQRLKKIPPYTPDVLYHIDDFRVTAGLYYLKGLCEQMGIASSLEPVLSFPLGSNVVTLFDIVRAYGTLVGGERVNLGLTGVQDALLVIDRIESRDGEVIYKPKKMKKMVVDPETSLAVASILRNVVRFGTGRAAGRDVKFYGTGLVGNRSQTSEGMPFPVLGKTGTANSFRNSAFAGFVPAPTGGEGRVGLEGGYALATYVGYDDNRPMVRKTTRISGSSGALPVWNRIANSIIKQYSFSPGMREGVASGSDENGYRIVLSYPELGQIQVDEGMTEKIVVDDLGKMSYSMNYNTVKYGDGLITFGTLASDGSIIPKRYFRPYWNVNN